MTVSGWNLSEVRPTEYDAGEEKGWENFKEETDSKYTYWSGAYEIMIEENGEFYTSEYMDWIVAYMESKGLKISVKSEEPLLVYRSPKDENSEKLRVISVSVGK